jgi:N-glycosylase/DNA lyase
LKRERPVLQAPAELRSHYRSKRRRLKERLQEFSRIWRAGREEDVFAELCFCLLTPQTSALACDAVVRELAQSGLLLSGTETELGPLLAGRVRFHHGKSRYIVLARRTFSMSGELAVRPILREKGTPYDMREWLVPNVLGLGYKEASHFLRNVGQGEDMAILDRHVLRNLVEYGVLEELPRTLTKKAYLEIEGEVRHFAASQNIPMAELDLLLWSKATGRIFK